MERIITIGRQFGSDGHEIGEKLSRQLGFPLYDKAIIDESAKKSGIDQRLFEKYDEKAMNSLLYSLVIGNYYRSQEKEEQPLVIRVQNAYFDTIRELAGKGCCIMVGRCADYILTGNPQCTSFFITADRKKRIGRISEKYRLSGEDAEKMIDKQDKERGSYYKRMTGKTWGAADNYDFCINSAYYGIDGSVELIKLILQSDRDRR